MPNAGKLGGGKTRDDSVVVITIDRAGQKLTTTGPAKEDTYLLSHVVQNASKEVKLEKKALQLLRDGVTWKKDYVVNSVDLSEVATEDGSSTTKITDMSWDTVYH